MVGLAVIRNVLLCQGFNANGRGMIKKIGKSVASDSVMVIINNFSGGLGQGGNLDWGYQAFFWVLWDCKLVHQKKCWDFCRAND